MLAVFRREWRVEHRRFSDLSQNGKNGVPGWLDNAAAFFITNLRVASTSCLLILMCTECDGRLTCSQATVAHR